MQASTLHNKLHSPPKHSLTEQHEEPEQLDPKKSSLSLLSASVSLWQKLCRI